MKNKTLTRELVEKLASLEEKSFCLDLLYSTVIAIVVLFPVSILKNSVSGV